LKQEGCWYLHVVAWQTLLLYLYHNICFDHTLSPTPPNYNMTPLLPTSSTPTNHLFPLISQLQPLFLPYPSPPSPPAWVPPPVHSAEVGAFISIFQRDPSRVKRIFLGWIKKITTNIDKDGICRHAFSSGNIKEQYIFKFLFKKILSTRALIRTFRCLLKKIYFYLRHFLLSLGK
jgi:hypothetical protein